MINRFTMVANKDFSFLRNDYSANVILDDEIYPSVEHAYQAAKTQNIDLRKKIQNASVHEARKIGKNEITIPLTWDTDRLVVMKQLQKSKYTDNLNLKLKLLLTGNEEIIQGGTMPDKFWGQDDFGDGKNHNGKIIMKVREEIKTEEGDFWLVIKNELKKLGINDIINLEYLDNDNFGKIYFIQ